MNKRPGAPASRVNGCLGSQSITFITGVQVSLYVCRFVCVDMALSRPVLHNTATHCLFAEEMDDAYVWKWKPENSMTH